MISLFSQHIPVFFESKDEIFSSFSLFWLLISDLCIELGLSLQPTSEVVLKAVGADEFLHGPMPLSACQYIRNRLKKNLPISFKLVPVESLTVDDVENAVNVTMVISLVSIFPLFILLFLLEACSTVDPPSLFSFLSDVIPQSPHSSSVHMSSLPRDADLIEASKVLEPFTVTIVKVIDLSRDHPVILELLKKAPHAWEESGLNFHVELSV